MEGSDRLWTFRLAMGAVTWSRARKHGELATTKDLERADSDEDIERNADVCEEDRDLSRRQGTRSTSPDAKHSSRKDYKVKNAYLHISPREHVVEHQRCTYHSQGY
eukprot:TRINITY_DN6380_c0_g1_i1.p2 TRINITY_DN6380_c0_g1~~TRINITY_DN6380_c0_g1_i1.p2  ORF type:complete len:106 (+),score=7.71 TRINITY_DN6380_c0_g1_i1:624-941(+)